MQFEIRYLILFFLILYLVNNVYRFHTLELFTSDILVVNFIGGIGNQLFYLASAYEYAKKFNKSLVIQDQNEIGSYGKNRKFHRYIYDDFVIQKVKTDNFKSLYEGDLLKNKEGNLVVSNNSYYQNYHYFIKTRKEFIKKINLGTTQEKKNILQKYNIKDNKNICIHLRFTDVYTPDDWPGIYSSSEIKKMINHLKEHYNEFNKLIFSNNIELCKPLFSDTKNINYVEEKENLELYLMSSCQIYYVSPSTFNWWGLYFNLEPEKVYVAWERNHSLRKSFYNNLQYLEKKLESI